MSPSHINPNKQWHPRCHTSVEKKKNNNMQPNTKFYKHNDTRAAKSSQYGSTTLPFWYF